MMKLKKYKKRTMKNMPRTFSSPQDDPDDPDEVIVLDNNEENNTPDATEVIDLDNYDLTGKKKRKRASWNNCINIECENGANLRAATIFCLNFYRVKIKPTKNQEVCEECYEKSVLYYEKLSQSLKSGDTCLIEEPIPPIDEFVEIDSDSDSESNIIDVCVAGVTACQITDDCFDMLAKELPSTMDSILHKYELDKQINNGVAVLEEKEQRIEKGIDEMETMEKDLQKRLDKVRSTLYGEFQRRNEEITPVEFSLISPNKTTVVLPPSSVTSPPRKDPERRSNRNINKPASYCELMDDDAPAQDLTSDLEVTQEMAPQERFESAPSTITPEINLPPRGTFLRTRPQIGNCYYAQRQSVFGAWGKVRLLDIDASSGKLSYKVKFEGKTKGLNSIKFVTGKQLAYSLPTEVRLEVGTRVIAVFLDESTLKKDSFYAGVIAEPLSQQNDWRYLVFFEDGYAQYVKHEKVLVICECSPKVWEDIHPDSQNFIKKYLETYPARPMVKIKTGQVMKTEWNGRWYFARVLRVDCSLVHMYFDADNRSEWIYRGSTRLGPLFLEFQAATARQEKAHHIPKLQQKQNSSSPQPYVEYPKPQSLDGSPEVEAIDVDASGAVPPPARAVARKSTCRPPNTLPQPSNIVPFLPTHTVQQPQSKVVYFTPKSVVPPKPFRLHTCSAECAKLVTLPLNALKGYNPLSKPLLVGWHRQMFKYKGKKGIRYRAPCGRSIRNMVELHSYLRVTQSDMSVDNFDFDYWVHCLAEFVLDKTFRSKRDISNGIENVPIPCVNYVDTTLPDFCNYSTKRTPLAGVNLNLDENFLCGCECTDDCSDKSKCKCWQLTIREARTLNKRVPEDLIGYSYKRLPDCVTTGIYECNSRCKCAKTCLNRVVQHPLQLKLQLFKTANRGWGIRCLNDLPLGTFICIYAGNLLTDKMANERGTNYGDDYLAELDYIEVVERQKDGYESDVTDIEDENENENDNNSDNELKNDSSDALFVSNVKVTTGTSVQTRSRNKVADDSSDESTTTTTTNQQNAAKPTSISFNDDETVTISDDEEIVREKTSFLPSDQTEEQVPQSKFKSVRKLFGEDEVCYIMDAKNIGNIGRFLNHSCTPNVFVQNVFVDTHDLRFPWVAFFAMTYIRAGTELTWNYNYDVGSVPGKVIFCHCGSPDCRGRLL